MRHDAVLVGFNREIARLIGVERLNCAQIRWMFADDVVARIEEDLADQIEPLLRTVDDQNLRGVEEFVQAVREPLRDPRTHFRNALGDTVL